MRYKRLLSITTLICQITVRHFSSKSSGTQSSFLGPWAISFLFRIGRAWSMGRMSIVKKLILPYRKLSIEDKLIPVRVPSLFNGSRWNQIRFLSEQLPDWRFHCCCCLEVEWDNIPSWLVFALMNLNLWKSFFFLLVLNQMIRSCEKNTAVWKGGLYCTDGKIIKSKEKIGGKSRWNWKRFLHEWFFFIS